MSIGANCVIEKCVSIGAGSTIHPNVTLYAGTVIGERVIIHSGTVIGSDGFGFARRRLQEIADHRRCTGFEAVQDHIVAGQPDKVALQLEADDPGMRHSRRQAQHCG